MDVLKYSDFCCIEFTPSEVKMCLKAYQTIVTITSIGQRSKDSRILVDHYAGVHSMDPLDHMCS